MELSVSESLAIRSERGGSVLSRTEVRELIFPRHQHCIGLLKHDITTAVAVAGLVGLGGAQSDA